MTSRAALSAALALAAASILGWAAWSWLAPRPALEPIMRLVDAGRTQGAEVRLRALLARDPGNIRAHLLFAVLVEERLDRPSAAQLRDAVEHARIAAEGDRTVAVEAWVVEGKLCDQLRRFDQAEAAWKAALALDPTADAGWLLLKLYDAQARRREGRALALRLYRLDPNPAAKRAALVELLREEVHQPAAAGIIALLSPVVNANPADLQSRLALGKALAREGRSGEGLPLLRAVVEERPDDREAWSALLNALADAGELDALRATLATARQALGDDVALARFDGWLALEREDWPGAVLALRRALEADPRDLKLGYRLSRALRLGGQQEDAARVDARVRTYDAARKALRQLYEKHQAELQDRLSHPALFQEAARLLERMDDRDTARGWHALVLSAHPSDPISLAAVERLK